MAEKNIGIVDAIWLYPISSVGGQKVAQAQALTGGLRGDRAYAIFDDETLKPADPISKEWCLTAKLLARVSEDGKLELSIEGQKWLRHDDSKLLKSLSDLYQRKVSIRPYGQDSAGSFLANRYKFSPVHLLSVQSLAKLQYLLPKSNLNVRRFRPNLLVNFLTHHIDPPEYQLIGKEFRVGNLRLRGREPCGRCGFTCLEQLGIPVDHEVPRTLISQFDNNFGIYCDVVEEGWISEGDSIIIDQPASYQSPVLVIGGGIAGATVAQTLREYGHTGSITILGEEGYNPYERPPLSKRFELPAPKALRVPQAMSFLDAQRLKVALELNQRVVHIDRQAKVVETLQGTAYSYGHLVIATGGSARRLPMVRLGQGRTHYIRTIVDAEHLQQAFEGAKRLFIVGGGWLGLEIASAAKKIGIDVELFARQAHLCSRILPHMVADYIAKEHIRHGVNLHMSCEPVFYEYEDRVEAHFNDQIKTADLLFVAIGMTANDHLAKHSGLDCSDGVLTNEDGATDDPHVFAVGDVSRQRSMKSLPGTRIESWQNAVEQAGRAAKAILGLERPSSYVQRFWSEQYDSTIQIIGAPDPRAQLVNYDDSGSPFWQFETFAVGIDRPRDVHRFGAKLAGNLPDPTEGCESQATEPIPQKAVRHRLGRVGDIASGELKLISSEGPGEILLARVGDDYFAIQSQCPHGSASLAEGFVENKRVVCPLHFAEFDLNTGAAYTAPKGCPNATTYRVEAEGDLLYIWITTDKL